MYLTETVSRNAIEVNSSFSPREFEEGIVLNRGLVNRGNDEHIFLDGEIYNTEENLYLTIKIKPDDYKIDSVEVFKESELESEEFFLLTIPIFREDFLNKIRWRIKSDIILNSTRAQNQSVFYPFVEEGEGGNTLVKIKGAKEDDPIFNTGERSGQLFLCIEREIGKESKDQFSLKNESEIVRLELGRDLEGKWKGSLKTATIPIAFIDFNNKSVVRLRERRVISVSDGTKAILGVNGKSGATF